MSLDDRRYDSEDSLRYTGLGHAASAPETCETTRNLAAQQPAQYPASNSRDSCRQLSAAKFKNYEHIN
jgi:hypothetical protein